ncbi:glutaredoxin family protein [Undibacterium cyanobacteriorum]|uniref:Glutaredoxin family protein n=2 Tax=Undibacterium cyanobacteriorum TaxID=3073561 RepID=A0ABY9RPN4_9BURK|nr:glutaredoxin family protein [Undibacterium sp. 20NA77.5]WMW82407.1 glutaredoxin family protein [Undibacterium sp. 20NA77.5]
MLRFTLYSRSYCHLCHDMLEQLRAELSGAEHNIEMIDIDLDGNEELLEQYDELVPVLCAIDAHGQAHQLCHYFLDCDKLTAYRLSQS